LHIDNQISVLNQEIDVKLILGELMMLYCDIESIFDNYTITLLKKITGTFNHFSM